MERRDKERELVAMLLSTLCPETLKPQDITLGFSLVLQTIKVRRPGISSRPCIQHPHLARWHLCECTWLSCWPP